MLRHLTFTTALFVAAIVSAQTKDAVQFTSSDPDLTQAFAIAKADIHGNIKDYHAGLLEQKEPVLMAGAGYDTPWTRDAAINSWNAAGLLWPDVARSTLLSVLERRDGRIFIGGQYWDAILWTTGAWNYYLYTGDRTFLSQAFDATRNTLAEREAEEFDPERRLFRGPAVYGDGVAAYPDRYAKGAGGSSAILDWRERDAKASAQGNSLPMFTLSTNCAYFEAYMLLTRMARALGQTPDPSWASKASQLKDAINKNFWDAKLGRYITLVDSEGSDPRQEALGLAFAVLFGVADSEQQASLFRHVDLTPAGMPCLWPAYDRYAKAGGFGRHSGTVWPHAEAFWADASARTGHQDLFFYDLTRLASRAVRDGQFYEIYNPISGEPDGGLQEQKGHGIIHWTSQPHQTWSATGYLRLVLFDLAGMHFDENGLTFAPVLPGDVHQIHLSGLKYRSAVLDVNVSGSGQRISRMVVNGREIADHRIPANAKGLQRVDITMAR